MASSLRLVPRSVFAVGDRRDMFVPVHRGSHPSTHRNREGDPVIGHITDQPSQRPGGREKAGAKDVARCRIQRVEWPACKGAQHFCAQMIKQGSSAEERKKNVDVAP